MTYNSFIPGLLSILLVSACTLRHTPDSRFFYSVIPKDAKEVSFDIDMSDSSSIYSISIAARFAKKFSHRHVPMSIEAVSPSGVTGYETVTFPCDYNSVKNYARTSGDSRIELAGTSGYYDICWKYRENIFPEEKGKWQLKIAIPDTISGITGIGVVIDRTTMKEQ